MKSATSPVKSGEKTAGDEDDNNQTSAPRRQRDRGKRGPSYREGAFRGRCDELKGAVYDIVAGKESFLRTTREIAEYVGSRYEDAGEFRIGMVELSLPTLAAPTHPADATKTFEMEEWKIAFRMHQDAVRIRKRNNDRVYALVLGQCARTLRNRVEAHKRWATIDATSDVIGLLKIIQECIIQGQTRRYDMHCTHDAEHQFYQGANMSCHDYYEKYKDIVMTALRLGSDLGSTRKYVEDVLKDKAADPNKPTDAELKHAIATSHNRYIAMGLLLHSDPRRYSGMVRDVENFYTFGKDIYPETLDEAYDYLVNYKVDRRGNHGDQGGLSFLADGDPNGGRGRGRGGRGGRGGGRNARGGRQSERGNPSARTTAGTSDDPEPLPSAQPAKDGTHSQFLLDNEPDDEVDDYSLVIARLAHCHRSACLNALDPNLLLLDSCSTVNLISNRNMLTGIHRADTPLQVRCNAGTKHVTMMGTFGDFPEQVWYDPHGATNILSLYTVSKYYAVTYDSSQDDTFHVTNAQGDTYHFAPTGMGLYAHHCTPGLHWAFISTVAGNALQYSRRGQVAARLARRV